MYPTWPMVVAALVAGLIGGIIVPDRPRSHAAAEAPRAPAEGASKKSRSETTNGVTTAQTSEPAHAGVTIDSDRDQAATDDRKSCAIETWPYRTPNCLDRTVAVEPAHTVVSAKRVDPSMSLKAAVPPDDAEKSKQKIVSAPAARGDADHAMRPSAASGTSVEKTLEPAAKPAPARRPVRRASDRAPSREWREAPRAYIRGPDGRIYLAPEYRPNPPRYYYIR